MSISNEQFLAFIKKNPLGIGCAILSIFLAAFIYYRADLLPAVHTVVEEKSKEGERLAANVKYSSQLREQLDELTASGKVVGQPPGESGPVAEQFRVFLQARSGNEHPASQLDSGVQRRCETQPEGGFRDGRFSPSTCRAAIHKSWIFLHRLETGLHYCRILNSTFAKVGIEGDLLTLNLTVELLGQK